MMSLRFFDRFRPANWSRRVCWALAGCVLLAWWIDLQTIPQPTLQRAFLASMSRVLSVGVLAFCLYLGTRPLPVHIRNVVSAPVRVLRLTLTPGGRDKEDVRLQVSATPLVFGRSGVSDIVIDAPHVSGHHCRIWIQDNRVLLQDLGSRNGTWLGDVRLGEAPVIMTPNCQYLLGGMHDGVSLRLED